MDGYKPLDAWRLLRLLAIWAVVWALLGAVGCGTSSDDPRGVDGTADPDGSADTDVTSSTDSATGDDTTGDGGSQGDASAVDAGTTGDAGGQEDASGVDADTADGAATDAETGEDADAGCESAAACEDDDPCTDGTCVQGACLFVPNTAPCDDQDPCTKDDSCTAGTCTGTLYTCENGGACQQSSCDGQGGCTTENPSGTPCDDADACTEGDTCDGAGNCVGPTPKSCDDGNACTSDSCAPATGCLYGELTGACDDGDSCTKNDQCGGGTCSGEAYSCPDGGPCILQTCDGLGGCDVAMPSDVPCSDGDACTVADACDGQGVCKSAEAAICDDGKLCTTDSCDPALGCVATDVTGPCDDGDVCTVGDSCVGGDCVPAGQLDCNDDEPCTTDSCAGGCKNTPNALPCDDGEICTVGDTCADGACASGLPDLCDDGNACTTDACDPVGGCQHTNVTSPCDDGDACTIDDVCIDGACVSKPKDCDDGQPCTKDACVAGTCGNLPDDSLTPPSPVCAPDPCNLGTSVCNGGVVACELATINSAANGQPCGAWGEGSCQEGQCYQPAAPVVIDAWFESGPVLAGTTATVRVVVEDGNNDAAAGSNEIVSVVYHDVDYGGEPLPLALVPGSAQGTQVEYVGTVTIPVPEEDPNNIRYIDVQATDTVGRVGSFTLAQLIYKGDLIPVGPTRPLTTIAAGIAAAESGDVVVVDPGVYTGPGNVNVNGTGKQIYVHGPGVTVDCNNDQGGSDSFLIMNGPSFDQAQFAIVGITVQHCANSAVRLTSPEAHLMGVTLVDATLRSNSSPDGGGAVHASGGGTWVTLLHSELHDNTSEFGGGALYATSGAHLRVLDSVLHDNHATGLGDVPGRGGAHMGEEAGDALYERVAVYGNTAVGDGGAFWLRNSPVNLQDTVFTENAAGAARHGAAIFGKDGDLHLHRCQFLHHEAGSAVFSDNAIYDLVDGVFEGNVADGPHAGAVASNKGGSITGTQFRNNKGTPGAVSVGDFDTAIIGAKFVGNTSAGDGGAIAVGTAELQLFDSLFENNTAKGIGGALYVSSHRNHIVSNSEFVGNTAGLSGGGAHLPNGLISGLRFEGNTAGGDGGGLVLTSQVAWFVQSCTFVANTSGGDGGGLWFSSDGWFQVSNVELVSNVAAGDGGGVFGTGTSSGNAHFVDFTLRNNAAGGSGGGAAFGGSFETYNHLAVGNQAKEQGGAFWLRFGNVQLIAGTTHDNQAHQGGGIWVSDGELRLENAIVWGNVLSGMDGSGAALGVDPTEATATAVVKATNLSSDAGDIHDPGVRINEPVGFAVGAPTENISTDPLFVFGPNGEHWLAHIATGQPADSPCIDAGNTQVFDWLPWTQGSTRSDGAPDTGKLDLGYRYPL